MNVSEFAKMIDSSLLASTATESEVRELCNLAKYYGFATVALGSAWIPLAAELLAGSGVGVDAPVGFPLGYSTTETKVFETEDAIKKGALEIDMVINLCFLKSGMYMPIKDEIRRVLDAAQGHIVKVIIETCYLSQAEKIKAAEITADAGANFVKTSTGFGPSGATVEDIRLLHKTVGDRILVKASGGIRTFSQAMDLINAGATRLGASNADMLAKAFEN